jgi:hypothetical protein
VARKGKVFEVSVSRQPCEYCARIGPVGFEGDRSGTAGIVLSDVEVVREINARFAAQLPDPIQAGMLGDNILTEGLGNPANLEPGTLFRIGNTILLRLEAKAAHYREMFSDDLPEEALVLLMEKGGVECSVVAGIGHRVVDNEEIEILPAEELKGAA